MRVCQHCRALSIKSGADERLLPATVLDLLQVEQLVGIISSSCTSQATKVTMLTPVVQAHHTCSVHSVNQGPAAYRPEAENSRQIP